MGLLGSLVLPAVVWADEPFAPLDVRQVQVGGEIARRIDITANNNLLKLRIDKEFLLQFQRKSDESGYVGLGKTIEAAVRFAAYLKSDALIALKKHLIDETIKAQEPDGYIGIMAKDSRMWHMWDVHEIGYIIDGLTCDYHYFGEKRSLEAAAKLADYVIRRWPSMPADWQTQTRYLVDPATMGLDSGMLAVFRATGERRFFDFCIKERSLIAWDLGIVVGRRLLMEADASAYISKAVAQLELHHFQPHAELLPQSRRLERFLAAGDGMCITGAIGEWECFTDDQDGRNALGETCATAYQIRLFNHLLQVDGKAVHGDLIERTMYNTLFAAQSPDGRKLRYFTPMEGKRAYHHEDGYCCPCNYRRVISELPSMVYYRTTNGLAVNLYTPSEANVSLGGEVSLKVRQETDYPNSGHVVVHLNPSKPAQFPLRLRIPLWCPKSVTASVNGEPVQTPIVPGTFLAIDRQWKAGDRVALDMPMPWRLVAGRKRQAGRAAVMRGPVVYCLNPAQDKSLANMDGADLGFIVLDAASLQDAPGNDASRPGGMACRLKASRGECDIGCSGDLPLLLTEFPDPAGCCTYFRLPDLSVAVPDELIAPFDAAN